MCEHVLHFFFRVQQLEQFSPPAVQMRLAIIGAQNPIRESASDPELPHPAYVWKLFVGRFSEKVALPLLFVIVCGSDLQI